MSVLVVRRRDVSVALLAIGAVQIDLSSAVLLDTLLLLAALKVLELVNDALRLALAVQVDVLEGARDLAVALKRAALVAREVRLLEQQSWLGRWLTQLQRLRHF